MKKGQFYIDDNRGGNNNLEKNNNNYRILFRIILKLKNYHHHQMENINYLHHFHLVKCINNIKMMEDNVQYFQ